MSVDIVGSAQAAVGVLPEHLQDRANPERAGVDALAAIRYAIENHPRSLQQQIGPSEVGEPCSRKLGYKLLGTPERPQQPNWKATVGTAVHLWLQEVLDAYNVANAAAADGEERYLLESKVTTGYVPGVGFVTGSCDVYDRVTATVIDWKTTTPDKVKKYRAGHIPPAYQVQPHLYGLGWVNRGMPVDQVALIFLPRNGELSDAYVWQQPFDPQVGLAALQRLSGIAAATTALGIKALDVLPTADSYCTFCPFYRRDSVDLSTGCPGHAGKVEARVQGQLDGLLDPTTRPISSTH